MNSRSPRRKFVFLCCVTLLELIDKKTFGINMDSPQGHESKRFSLFYKVKEGMFKNSNTTQAILFCNLCHKLLVLDKIFSHFAYQGKAKEYLIFHSSGFCDLRFVKNRCHTTRGAAKLKNLNVAKRLHLSENLQKEKLYQINI